MAVKQVACDRLLGFRVEAKVAGRRIGDVLNRIHVAVPKVVRGCTYRVVMRKGEGVHPHIHTSFTIPLPPSYSHSPLIPPAPHFSRATAPRGRRSSPPAWLRRGRGGKRGRRGRPRSSCRWNEKARAPQSYPPVVRHTPTRGGCMRDGGWRRGSLPSHEIGLTAPSTVASRRRTGAPGCTRPTSGSTTSCATTSGSTTSCRVSAG